MIINALADLLGHGNIMELSTVIIKHHNNYYEPQNVISAQMAPRPKQIDHIHNKLQKHKSIQGYI